MTIRTPHRILVIGFSCRAAAQAAREEGFEVSVVDRCGDRDTRELACDFALAPDSGTTNDWIRILSPLAKSCDDYLLAGGTECDRSLLAAIETVDFCRGYASSKGLRSIGTMRSFDNWARWGAMAHIPVPFSVKLVKGLPSTWRELGSSSKSLLLKKQKSSGGLGVSVIHEETPLESIRYSKDDILQEKKEGESIGVCFLSSSYGSIAIGCCRATTTPCYAVSTVAGTQFDQMPISSSPHFAVSNDLPHPWGPFVYAGSEGPMSLMREEWEALDTFGLCVSRESGWIGLWQADFIRDTTGRWYLLEINPRWTSSMELLSKTCAVNLVVNHFKAVHHQYSITEWNDFYLQSMLQRSRRDFVLRKRVLYAPCDYSLHANLADAWWARRWTKEQPLCPGVYYADIPNELGPIPFGFPVCSEIEVNSHSDTNLSLHST